VSADLLAHFLTGKGTSVHYRAGSPIAKKARASEAFRALNADVQKTILGQLKAGGAHWLPDTITVTVPFSRPA
jgi:hypothetical protein